MRTPSRAWLVVTVCAWRLVVPGEPIALYDWLPYRLWHEVAFYDSVDDCKLHATEDAASFLGFRAKARRLPRGQTEEQFLERLAIQIQHTRCVPAR
jgi:hypothetical protein